MTTREQLEQLRQDLAQDLMYCQSRDQHLRLVQRIEQLDAVLTQC